MGFLEGKKIYCILIYINYIFILSLIKTCYKISEFDYFFVSIAFIIGVIIYYLYSEILIKKSYKIMFTLAFCIMLELVCYNKLKDFNYIINEWYINNFKQINVLVYNSLETHFVQFKPYFGLIVPITTCVLLFLTSKGIKVCSIIFNLVFMLYFWYLGFIDQVKAYLFIYILLSLITYSINLYIKRINEFKKNGVSIGINHNRVIIIILITSIAIALVGNSIPQEFQGFSYSETWTGLQNKFARNSSNIIELSSETKYNLASSGYDDSERKLGGPISLNSSTVFKVKSDGVYYLKGAVKDYYDGFSWKESNKKYKKENILTDKSILEKITADLLGNKKSITIFPDSSLKTSSFFVPQLSYNISTSDNGVYYNNIPTFMSDGEINKEYTVKFYESNINGNAIDVLGKNSEGDNNKNNYGQYLQVPKNVSPAIYKLVNRLIKDCNTDDEKVKKIQSYLKDNYQYTLNVSSVPKGHEFIDYFIFTEKKGYCTYFATAATIFYRIAGIPARYVEGFNMQDIKDNNGFYIVTNENAHAWSEVLLMKNENSGMWVTVDSVPGILTNNNNTNNQITANEEMGKQEKDDESNLEAMKDNKDEEEMQGGSTVNTDNSYLPNVMKSTSLVFIILLILTAVRIVLFIRKKNSILKNDSITPLYLYTNKRLKYIAIIKPDNMADMEFAETIKNDELKLKMKEIVNAAYEEFYGNKVSGNFDKGDYYKFIEEYVKNRQSKFRYYFGKYIF